MTTHWSRTSTMRLAAFAFVALVIGAGPGRAAPCIARAHKGAIPYYFAGGTPADTLHGSHDAGPNDAEVTSVERDDNGQLWVSRVHDFAWKRQDVDLRGDCRRALSP